MATLAIVVPRSFQYNYDLNLLESGWFIDVFDNSGAHIDELDSYGFTIAGSDSPGVIRTKILQGAIDAAAEFGVTVPSTNVIVLGYIDRGP